MAAPLLVAGLPHGRRLIWELEDSWWTRRSWHELSARNRLPLAGVDERLIGFGAHPRQQARWFYPAGGVPPRRPLLFFIHGGGWEGGHIDALSYLGRSLARRGFPCVTAGYRLLADAVLPEMLADLATGLRLGIEECRERGWRGTATVIGQSAGGHLGALLTFAGPHFLGDTHVVDAIGGLVTLGGMLDLSRIRSDERHESVTRLIGQGAEVAAADPMRYAGVSPGVPVLCVHGRKDWLVEPAQSRAFVDRVNLAGGRAELLLLRGRHHADIIEVLDEDSAGADAVFSWIERQSGSTAP